MISLRVQTPSRLHFGLLGWGPDSVRQFGGVGLMIEDPGIRLIARPAQAWSAEGPLADRVLRVAHALAAQLPTPPVAFLVETAPGEHLGLGVGTQVSLAVAQAILALAGEPAPSLETLARLTGRGLRSGIGLHGFRHGGFIVDGGRGAVGGIPPLLARLPFPAEWSVLVVTPGRGPGLHGTEEASAFAKLPAIPQRVTDRLCRSVLLGIMPALIEHDLEAFGRSLTELQEEVGLCFAPAQGGRLASARSAEIVADLRRSGLHGVGQSSWGPTLYGFSIAPQTVRERVAEELKARFSLAPGSVRWTKGSQVGCSLDHIES
ncbi:MAG: beta-RFAP synthase [Isosphaeraceae bacterium]|nr:beta-RFAP synthase [Isosphaeraceae bacterium]